MENSRKIKILVLAGGPGAEHQVSLISGKSIFESLDRELFEPSFVAMDKDLSLYFNPFKDSSSQSIDAVSIERKEEEVVFSKNGLFNLKSQAFSSLDVVFNIVHGTLGEDGSLQGLLKCLNIPFIGCGVYSSALCMDKIASKKALNAKGVPSLPGVDLNFENPEKARVFADKQGLPLFVKPANTGSSIGISKVMEISELDGALEKAFKIDDQILIEKAFVGREIEFAVLNNLKTGQLEVSPPGEIKVYGDGFYSYEAKYLNPEKVELIAPAAMDEASLKKAQKIAIDAFEALECKDFARVDLFVGKNEIYVNEINTLPGFTGISMFPKLWILAGFSYQDLLSNVVFSALKRQNLNLFENFSDKLKELNLL